jgi:drug/metabolite transporter (DMT)-like permease
MRGFLRMGGEAESPRQHPQQFPLTSNPCCNQLMSIQPAEVLVALTAAAAWGGGDFSGGMGVKAAGGSTAATVRFVLLAHATSLIALLIACGLLHPPLPHGAPADWALVAGVTSALAIIAFYLALSRGTMGPSAAVSGLLAAAIPAVVSSILEGAPGWIRLLGFLLAAAAIWAIAAGEASDAPGTMLLAIAGGLGFGIYFVALRLANPLGVWEPMALARTASVATCALLFLIIRRRDTGTSTGKVLTPTIIAWAMGVALLDTGGNLLFVAATRMGRLDVAAVLASLYPVSTILLAAWRLHERPTRRQLAGMALAVAAVVMITW